MQSLWSHAQLRLEVCLPTDCGSSFGREPGRKRCLPQRHPVLQIQNAKLHSTHSPVKCLVGALGRISAHKKFLFNINSVFFFKRGRTFPFLLQRECISMAMVFALRQVHPPHELLTALPWQQCFIFASLICHILNFVCCGCIYFFS